MKKACILVLISSVLFCALPYTLWAQKPIKHYMKNDGSQVKREKDADYIRVFMKEGGEDDLFTLTEYYPDQQVKRTGKVPNTGTSPTFHGLMVSYYPNGQEKEEVNFVEGRKAGSARYHYDNGQLRKVILYAVQEFPGPARLVPDTVLQYFDSLGNVLLTEGNGFVKETDDDLDFEEGEYLGGVREGEWTGTFHKQRYTFTENYREGVLLSGMSRDTVGKEYEYNNFGTPPRFGNGAGSGIDNFRRTVSQLFNPPANAIRAGVSGLINIEFVIDEEGKTTEFTIVADPGHGLGRAAINAVRAAGDWIPGYQRGVPVRVKYALPLRVNFESQRSLAHNQ